MGKYEQSTLLYNRKLLFLKKKNEEEKGMGLICIIEKLLKVETQLHNMLKLLFNGICTKQTGQ